MLFANKRGGVPVFRRNISNPAVRSATAKLDAAGRPSPPPSSTSFPIKIFPASAVPVVNTTFLAVIIPPLFPKTPSIPLHS
jgi:hypothetical protein